MAVTLKHTALLLCISYAYALDPNDPLLICGDLSFSANLVLMIVYFCIVCASAYCYGRHRGEYAADTRWLQRAWTWLTAYLLLYLITLSWIYYSLQIEIAEHFPWLTLYGASYCCYSLLFTVSFAHHAKYSHHALLHWVCWLCTVLPLALALASFVLLEHVDAVELGLFDPARAVPVCLSIDRLSLALSSLLLVAFGHHLVVLGRVLHSLVSNRNDYLTNRYEGSGRLSSRSRSTTHSRGRSGMVLTHKRRTISDPYVYRSDSESHDGLDEEIEVKLQVPINHSVNVHDTFAGSVSYDL